MKIKRKIDEKFAVSPDGVIFKMSNGETIPDDEPLFIFRGRDRLAVLALRAYRDISASDACNDYHFEHLEKDIRAFEDFAINNPERMKQPSITRGK